MCGWDLQETYNKDVNMIIVRIDSDVTSRLLGKLQWNKVEWKGSNAC